MRNLRPFSPIKMSIALFMVSYVLWRFSINETTSCKDYFHNNTYNFDPGLLETILMGENHGANERHVADCLETLANKGDHLLIESPGEGKEIPCDEIHSAYKRFNGKLKCFSFDVPMSDESRRTYSDLVYRVNFIADKSPKLFINATSGKAVISRIISFADALENYKSKEVHPKYFDSNFNKRTAKYLRKLGKSMQGLNIPQMQDFLSKENNRLATKADQIGKESNRDAALVREVIAHRKQLKGTPYRLFAVAGANHINPNLNSMLQKEIIQSKEPITILTPK